jgi:hypothetical protein
MQDFVADVGFDEMHKAGERRGTIHREILAKGILADSRMVSEYLCNAIARDSTRVVWQTACLNHKST